MAIIFNGIDRLIEVTDPLIFDLDVEDDIYSRWKDWAQASEANAGYAPALRTFGGDATKVGQTAPKYFFLQNYWRVFINNGNVVSVGLNLYTDDYITPYIVGAGSGISDTNSDAVNVNEEDIKNQSFLGAKVYINTEGFGVPGTIYPTGTPPNPSDNWEDSVLIATSRNYNSYNLRGSIIYSGSIPSPTININIGCSSSLGSSIVFDGRSVDGSAFTKLNITGSVIGRADYIDCSLGAFTGFQGRAENCDFYGDIIIDSAAVENIMIKRCVSDISGALRPTLYCNGVSADIGIRDYIGGLTIEGFTSGNNMSIDCPSATIEIGSTCTAGVIVVRGTTQLIDNSGPVCSVIKEGTVTELVSAAGSVWTNQEKVDLIADTSTIKDQSEIAALHATEELNP